MKEKAAICPPQAKRAVPDVSSNNQQVSSGDGVTAALAAVTLGINFEIELSAGVLLANKADNFFRSGRRHDLNKINAVDWKNHLVDFFIQVMNILAVATSRILEGNKLRRFCWQLFDFSDNRVFIINVYDYCNHEIRRKENRGRPPS